MSEQSPLGLGGECKVLLWSCHHCCGPVIVVVVLSSLWSSSWSSSWSHPCHDLHCAPSPSLSSPHGSSCCWCQCWCCWIIVVGPWCSFLAVLFPLTCCCHPIVLSCTCSHPTSTCSQWWSWVLKWWLCHCCWPVVLIPTFPLVLVVGPLSLSDASTHNPPCKQLLTGLGACAGSFTVSHCVCSLHHCHHAPFAATQPTLQAGAHSGSWGCYAGHHGSCPLSSPPHCFLAPTIHLASRCSQGWGQVLSHAALVHCYHIIST